MLHTDRLTKVILHSSTQVESSPVLRNIVSAISAALFGIVVVATTLTPNHVLAADAGASSSKKSYSVAAGPLSQVLYAFASSAGITLSFDPNLTEGLHSPGLSGSHSVQDGLDKILVGSGLEMVAGTNGGYRLRKLPDASAAVLPAVHVTASNLDAGTEGSGSYRARGVTIGKTTQTLREIPQSVSVITRQEMDDQNVITLSDAVKQTTGVSVRPDTEGSFYARGFSMDTQVDGVQGLNSNALSIFDMAIYDRVEVMRGPSGMLSGTGNPGGVVNLVRKRPLDRLAIAGTVSAGSWNNYYGNIDLSSPLTESGNVRGRVVASAADRDFYQNVLQEDTKLFYGILEVDLTRSTTLAVSTSQQKKHAMPNFGIPFAAVGKVPTNSFAGSTEQHTRDLEEYALELKHRTDNDWVFKLSLRDFSYYQNGKSGFVSTYNANQSGNITLNVTDAYWKSQELDLNASGKVSLWGREHDILIGANSSTQDNGSRGYQNVVVAVPNVFTKSNFSEYSWGVPNGTTSATRIEQASLYGMARLKLADPLTLILGARITDYENKSRSNNGPWVVSKANANNEFTPYGGLIFDLNKQWSVYTSYTDMFTPQTQQAVTGETLDPRVGWQIEAGIKGELYDGKMNVSLAAFRVRESNRAIADTANIAACNGGQCYLAAGLTQSQGWEAEVSGEVLPRWQVSAGYTRNDTKYIKDTTASNIGQPISPLTPRHLLRLWNKYQLDGDLSKWSVGGGISSQSSIYNKLQAGYTIASAQVGYRIDKNWSASLTVNNLTDKTYLSRVQNGNSFNLYGEPRNAMLTLRGAF